MDIYIYIDIFAKKRCAAGEAEERYVCVACKYPPGHMCKLPIARVDMLLGDAQRLSIRMHMVTRWALTEFKNRLHARHRRTFGTEKKRKSNASYERHSLRTHFRFILTYMILANVFGNAT